MVDKDSRFGFGNGEFCKILEDGLLKVLLLVVLLMEPPPIPPYDFELEPYGVVAIGMDEEVELRLVLVLNEDELLSLRILCAESALFRLFGDLEYNRFPVLLLKGDLLEEPEEFAEGGERPAVEGRPEGGFPKN